MKKKIEVDKKGKVRIFFKVHPQDATDEFKKNLVTLFSRKYEKDPSQIEVVFEYFDTVSDDGCAINSENIKNIQDPRFQQELIKKYIRINGITDCDIEEVLKIDSLINSTVDFEQYDKKSTYDINYIKFDNFLSYGDNNYIDFRNFNGLVLLRGTPANQSGKTTLCNDLIHFLLFGKVKSGKADSLDQIFNKFRPEKNQVVVEGSITVNGEEYIIKRTLTRPDKTKKSKQIKNEVNYYRVLEGGFQEEIVDYENLQGETVVQTNKALKDAIGRERDFDLMSCINAGNLSEIIYMKNTERANSLTRWYGLESIENKSNNAKEHFNKKIMVGRMSDAYNREGLKDDIVKLNEEIDENNKRIENNTKIINESLLKINDYKEMINTLHLSLKNIDKSLENIDFHTLVKEMDSIKVDGEDMGKYIEELKAQFNSFGEINYSEEQFKNLNNEDKGLIAEIAEIKTQIKVLKKDIKHLKESEYCPVCGKKFDNVDNSEIIKEKENKVNELIELGTKKNERKQVVEEMIKELDNSRKLREEKSKLELLLGKKEKEIVMKRSEYKEKLRLKKEIEYNKSAIEENNRTQNSLNIYKVKLDEEDKIKNRLTNENTSLSTENKAKNDKILEKERIISQIQVEQEIEKNWRVYLKAIGKDGISKMILKEAIPQMNMQIKNILEAADIQFNVEAQMTEKNDIRYVIKKGNVETEISSGSGYEQFVSGLTIRAVINQFSAIPKPPFLILDEIMGSVSSENLGRVRKLIETISHSYKFIFHVTHLEEVIDWHDRVITVEKKDNVSSINIK